MRIETDRYENPKLEPHNSLCIFCDLQIVEDENHFLLECPLYVDYRNTCYGYDQMKIKGFVNINSIAKFVEIMKNKNDKIVAAFGKYVCNSMIKRCEKIFVHYKIYQHLVVKVLLSISFKYQIIF